MDRSTETVLWGIVAVILAAFAIPWFLWGTDTVAAGLPVWLWWHIGWMVLASVTFAVFATRGWGLGISRGERL